jgi:hypothetical protein
MTKNQGRKICVPKQSYKKQEQYRAKSIATASISVFKAPK